MEESIEKPQIIFTNNLEVQKRFLPLQSQPRGRADKKKVKSERIRYKVPKRDAAASKFFKEMIMMRGE